MAPTYCMVKLFQKATYERLKRTLNGIVDNPSSVENHVSPIKYNETKCRICLKDGIIPIFNADGSSEIASAIRIFAHVIVSKDDRYPKHICEACQRLLQSAILFRKMAKKSNKILEQTARKQDAVGHQNYINKELSDHNNKKNTLAKYFIPVEIEEHRNKFFKETNSSLGVRKPTSKVQCQICYKIITKSYHKEHFSLHEAAPVKHVCDVCGKGFRLKSAYRAHLCTHSTTFPYKCHLCPYQGRYSGLLSTHMRVHIGDYKYKCNECPAKFIYKCNLNKHSLRHKEPLFQCGECTRKFHSKMLVDRHYEVEHLGIKNHICSLCGKAFGYRKVMMRHQLDVHKRKKKLNGRTPSYLEVEYLSNDAPQ